MPEEKIAESSRKIVGEANVLPTSGLAEYVAQRVRGFPGDIRDRYRSVAVNGIVLASSERSVVPKSRENFMKDLMLGVTACALAYLIIRTNTNHSPNVKEGEKN